MLQLRRADSADAATLADLYLRSRRAAAAIPPMVHSDGETRAWMAQVVVGTMETWLTETETGDAGPSRPTALMAIDGDELDQLYVDPECQGQGLGAALVALAQARRAQLALWTFEANARARHFYERHGFVIEGEPSADNEEATAAVRYRWRSRTTPTPNT